MGIARSADKAGADEAHRQSVAGGHRDATGIVADQVPQARADFGGGMPVVGKNQNPTRIFTPNPDQIGNPVDKNPRFARSEAGEHQHVGLFAIVRYDLLLHWIVERLDDCFPGCPGRLASDFGATHGHPASQEGIAIQHEVVFREPQRPIHRIETRFGIGRHHMGLDRLLAVVLIERCEVLLGKTTAAWTQMHGHRRSEHRQPLAERHHLLLVQPQEGSLHELVHVLHGATKEGVAAERGEQIAHRGFDLEVLAARSFGQLSDQVGEKKFRGLPADRSRLFQHRPRALQGDHEGVARGFAQPDVAAPAILITPVPRNSAQELLDDIWACGCMVTIAQRLTGLGEMQW